VEWRDAGLQLSGAVAFRSFSARAVERGTAPLAVATSAERKATGRPSTSARHAVPVPSVYLCLLSVEREREGSELFVVLVGPRERPVPRVYQDQAARGFFGEWRGVSSLPLMS
jgi:hypothetical protein